MYDPYGYDPYMMGGMYDPYGYDPYYMSKDDDDDDDDDDDAAADYAKWCAATNCNYRLYDGSPNWDTPVGSLGYTASPKTAFWPGFTYNIPLYVTAENPGNLKFRNEDPAALPPGLSFTNFGGPRITGTITPAVTLDTITFENGVSTYDLTKTAAAVTLNPITFDGSKNYALASTTTTTTATALDPLIFDMYNGPYYLTTDDGMNPYTNATDKTKLTIVDSYGITIPSGSYTITDMGKIKFHHSTIISNSITTRRYSGPKRIYYC